MTYNRVCPLCGTVNKGLDLQETKGLYECEKCGKVIHTSYSGFRQIRPTVMIRDKGKRIYDGK